MTSTDPDSDPEGLPVTYADIERARERLDDDTVVKRTPVERSTSLEEFVGGEVYLKMEHLQWTGSFKTRGAYNKISQAVDRGVDAFVAASAGNHAQGVALAATNCGAESTIFMPENAPQAKIDATRGYGATVELVGRDFQETMSPGPRRCRRRRRRGRTRRQCPRRLPVLDPSSPGSPCRRVRRSRRSHEWPRLSPVARSPA